MLSLYSALKLALDERLMILVLPLQVLMKSGGSYFLLLVIHVAQPSFLICSLISPGLPDSTCILSEQKEHAFFNTSDNTVETFVD